VRSLSTVSGVFRLVGLSSSFFTLSVGCDGETGFSKAPDSPVIQEGQGEITVEPMPIRIENLDWEAGTTRGQVVEVRNDGDNTLKVHDIALTSNAGGALYLEDVGSLNLGPGVSAEFSILATLTTFEPVESVLRIQSGDVDEPNLTIPILAVPEGYEFPDDTGDTGD